jgi:hypothetical protein
MIYRILGKNCKKYGQKFERDLGLNCTKNYILIQMYLTLSFLIKIVSRNSLLCRYIGTYIEYIL